MPIEASSGSFFVLWRVGLRLIEVTRVVLLNHNLLLVLKLLQVPELLLLLLELQLLLLQLQALLLLLLILLHVLPSKLANLCQVALLQLVYQTHLGVRRESLLLVELV